MGTERKWLFIFWSLHHVPDIHVIHMGLKCTQYHAFASTGRRWPGYPPLFANYIAGGKGDADRIFRLLLALYHPRNRHLLHIPAEGEDGEREKLGGLVKSVPVIRPFGNVGVIRKPDPNADMGSTNVAAVSRAVTVLLKVDGGWD